MNHKFNTQKVKPNKHMKVIRNTLLMALVLTGYSLFAQDSTYVLTLVQAREYALEHNRSLLNAKDQSISSGAKVLETVTTGLPQVKGSLDYTTYFNKSIELDFGGAPMSIPMNDAFNANIQVSQLIFSGQYIAGIQLAKTARQFAEQNVVLSELDVKENVTNSYYIILSTENSLNIIKENLRDLEEILNHTENLYKAGVAEETDVDQIKVTVSQLKNTQNSLERMNQLNYNVLKFQLGVAPETNIKLADSLAVLVKFIDSQLLIQSEFDLNNNINYQMMESQVTLAEKQLNMQYWDFTPTVAAFYSYTEKFKTTGIDFSPKHVGGVSLSWPLFTSGGRVLKVSQAKINYDIAQRNQDMVKDQLVTQQRQLLFNFQSALENYETQKESVATAMRVFTHIENKFKQGMVSSFELTQANSNYLTAESNYLTAVVTLLQAQTSLDKLYNRL
jgi:outer membrane protein